MNRRRDRGVALLLALLVLTLLAVLIGQMTLTSLHDRTLAENPLLELKNSYGVRSGYQQAILYLAADLERTPAVDTLHERWASPLEFDLAGARVRVVIRDTESLLNLSALVNEKGETHAALADRLRRLVRILGHPPDTAERIIDYIDADNRGSFEAGARNEPPWTLDELLRVEGLTREVLFGTRRDGESRKGLLEFLTVWPRPGGKDPPALAGAVNANTAPPELLAALSEKMTPALAEAIVTHRNSPAPGATAGFQDFQTPEDVRRVQGMTDETFQEISPHLVVGSSVFEIRARSRAGRAEKAWTYVIRRDAEKKALRLLATQRINDFLFTAPPEEGP